jgi:8-oxo-dGTP pyrophosphatase MutT (NUDIX family)
VRWTVHGERALYESEWVELMLADVEIPGGDRFDHHVVRMPRKASGTVVHDRERGLLLLWRHRFITDTWGWELPAGLIDEGETPEQAAARETLEETGHRPGPLRHLVTYFPTNGLSDQTFHLYLAESAIDEGPPADRSEAERVEWVPVDDARRLVREGAVRDGLSLVGLLWYFAMELADG